MEYYSVDFHIRCSEEQLQTCRDLLADTAGEAGFETFEDTEDGLRGYVQTHLFDRKMLDESLLSFPVGEADISYTVAPAEQKDWNETWEQQGFDPIFIEDQCVIYDARQQGDTPLSALLAPLRIGIEARMAFGTGTHETTRLVVAALLRAGLKDKRVLDCGCGTGILAIVAAKCGARNVVAYDIDEWSVENTRHNAALNHEEQIEVLHGDCRVLSHVSGMFDVVVANINRNILLTDMVHFTEVMSADGLLVLSGFYNDDVPLLVEEAGRHQLRLLEQTSEGAWACLVLGVNAPNR